jgi:SAM-dependent methyltransferase
VPPEGASDRPQFADFDSRGYRTVDPLTGYREWVATYEQTVEGAMDIELLEVLSQPSWPRIRRAPGLGCGTGRTGAWLWERGVPEIDGVDISQEMLALARGRGIYRALSEADVAATGMDSEAYDLVISCLVDEHLPTVEPLYSKAWRVCRPGATCVLVGYHPQFIMASGMPTHFESASGEQVAIETHIHLLSEHLQAGLGAGWRLAEMHERLIDDSWLELKPGWAPLRGQPVSFALAWQKPSS